MSRESTSRVGTLDLPLLISFYGVTATEQTVADSAGTD